MHASAGTQFLLLSWKNWLLQKRSIILTIAEIALPTLLAFILFIMRQLVSYEVIENPTTWKSFSVESFNSSFVPPSGVGLNNSAQWLLAYSPNTPVVVRIMDRVAWKLNMRTEGLAFQSEEAMLEYFSAENATTMDTWGGIVFNSEYSGSQQLSQAIWYTIRPKAEQYFGRNSRVRYTSASDWQTSYVYPGQYVGPRQVDEYDGGSPGEKKKVGYNREGFLTIQRALDQSIVLEHSSTAPVEDIAVQMKRHPFPPYVDDSFVYLLVANLPWMILLSFIVLAPNIVKEIVLEKETKLRESMKMMGLRNWVNWMAWFTKFLIFAILSVGIMTFFFHIDFGNGRVFNYSDPSLTFVFLLLYSVATIMFCFAISTFFSKASSGAAAGAILYLASFVPYSFIQYWYFDTGAGIKFYTSLFHSVAMAYGCRQYVQYESAGIGLKWNNFHQPVNISDNFTMLYVMMMLVVDSLIYGCIAWYVDAVKPGDYGIPLPFYFPFTKSYWCGTPSTVTDTADVELGDLDEGGFQAEYFESNPTDIEAGVRIRGLTKQFKKGKIKTSAVDAMHLDMFEGQITALLGHNGAGKTTTMFMLTGFIPPTSGTAYVNGFDIRKDIEQVRFSMGLCPQHDILFDKLTVEEHLYFFARLKGCQKSDVKGEVVEMVKVLNLEDKNKSQAKHLSGGMKRKLSVGIALCAGSKVVFLDEPTSGMDPEARRQTWDIIQGQRQGRTMLLTTHFMDEADFLGDRIAIMADGVVQCCGSSLFLKGKYGVGYHMVIVKEPQCDVPHLTTMIQKYVPEAKLESNISAELSYVLPRESSDKFEDLFTFLEENRQELGIASYGASVTTMEEVFLKVGEKLNGSLEERLQLNSHGDKVDDCISHDEGAGDNIAQANSSQSDIQSVDNTPGPDLRGHTSQVSDGGVFTVVSDTVQLHESGQPQVLSSQFEKNTGIALQLQQFRAMFEKRVLHSWRNRVLTVSQLLLPLIFTTIASLVVLIFPGPRDPPAMNLTIQQYDKPIAPYNVNGTTSGDHAGDLASAYRNFIESQGAEAPFINHIDGYEEWPSMEDYLLDMADQDLEEYTRYHITGATFEGDRAAHYNESTLAFVHFNNEAYHSPPTSLGMFANSLLQMVMGPQYTISVTNHPLPRESNAVVEEDIETYGSMSAIVAFDVSFGMAFLVCSFVLFVVRERVIKSKHIQFVSGVHAINFWMSTFCWDMINYLIPSILLLPIFAIFSLDPYVNGAGYTFLVLLFYGLAVIPATYVMSFLFNVPSSGYVWLTVLNILLGAAATITVQLLKSTDAADTASALEVIFMLFLPNYCFIRSMQDIFLNYQTLETCFGLVEDLPGDLDYYCGVLATYNQTNACCKDNCGEFCQNFEENYLAWDPPGIGRGICFMSLQCIVAFVLLFFIESGLSKKMWQSVVAGTSNVKVEESEQASIAMSATGQSQPEEDNDVKAERERILNTPLDVLQQTDSLVISQLLKFYGELLAVDRLSVGVPRGECFGLLGVNGAGKTTTFKMLTGDETGTSGNAWVDGNSVTTQIKEVQQRMGYCPQFDALLDQMTVKETLRMYGRLRGVREEYLQGVIESLIESLLLNDHASKLAGELSGGNKRKLSTAIALIGNPPIVFLDEPTTGMDPVARRLLWDTLTKVRATGRTLVLTSHSMEECEALCTRMGIMVNGQFKCLGSTQHLKNKFGEGYTLMAKVQPPDVTDIETTTQALKAFIEETFPGSTLKDLHQGYVHYQIKSDDLSWAEVFGTMERAKERYHLEDYSVSQTTLEQVFINFARAQNSPVVTNQTCWMKTKSCSRYFCCCGCCKPQSVSP